MATVLTNGALFLHVPKTGGSWVSSVLKKLGLVHSQINPKHADAFRATYANRLLGVKKLVTSTIPGELRSRITSWAAPAPQKRRFVFCFVRHPITWYESFWRYMNQRSWPSWGVARDVVRWHPCSPLNGLGSDDFNQFISNVLDNCPGYITKMYSGYTNWGANFVGHQETLQDDLVRVLCQMYGQIDEAVVSSESPRNESKKTADDIVWDRCLLEEVARVEHAAIKEYGYMDMTDSLIERRRRNA